MQLDHGARVVKEDVPRLERVQTHRVDGQRLDELICLSFSVDQAPAGSGTDTANERRKDPGPPVIGRANTSRRRPFAAAVRAEMGG
jgi:hypothetical protein